MTKYGFLGVLASLGGGVLIGFQAIASAMGSQKGFKNISLADVVGDSYVEWLVGVAPSGVERAVEYIAAMPLFVLLFCIGGFFFVLDYFLGRR
jgi:hypothetical protein